MTRDLRCSMIIWTRSPTSRQSQRPQPSRFLLRRNSCPLRSWLIFDVRQRMKPRITTITLGVADLPQAIRFYRDGLRFPTDAKDDAPIAFFMTGGVRLMLYPKKALAEDISKSVKPSSKGFGGFTLGHNVSR